MAAFSLAGDGAAGVRVGAIDGAAFEVDEVRYAYGDIAALNGVSLEIPKGRRVALLGANGSGKSTLLRLLAGLSFPASGSIRFLDEALKKDRLEEEEFFFAFRRRVGVVFQNPDVQLFNASVFDEVAFGPLQMGWPAQKMRDRSGGDTFPDADRGFEGSRAASVVGRREEAGGDCVGVGA